LPETAKVDAATLATWLARGDTAVLDLTTSSTYLKGHLKSAWFVLRSQLADSLRRIPHARRYVLTCPTGNLAHFAAAELQALVKAPVRVLDGGTNAWRAAGFGLEGGPARMAAPAIDRYRRPYEGTDSPREAMQAYLEWEYGLVAQLARDGTHHFRVL
jgi:rhodanese-related sulfurtransferase